METYKKKCVHQKRASSLQKRQLLENLLSYKSSRGQQQKQTKPLVNRPITSRKNTPTLAIGTCIFSEGIVCPNGESRCKIS